MTVSSDKILRFAYSSPEDAVSAGLRGEGEVARNPVGHPFGEDRQAGMYRPPWPERSCCFLAEATAEPKLVLRIEAMAEAKFVLS